MQFLQKFHDLLAVLGVEITRRLIGKYYLWTRDYRTCYCHTLLLSARELCREMLCTVRHCHTLHNLVDQTAAFLLRCPHVKKRKFHILDHAELVDEVEALEHESQAALTQVGAVVLAHVAHILAVKHVCAFTRVVEQTQDIQQR